MERTIQIEKKPFCLIIACLAVSHLFWGGPARGADMRASVKKLQNIILDGIERREVRPQFDMFQSYAGTLLDASAGTKTFSDKTGNCRLRWVDHMLRHPVQAIAEAEEFTRELHTVLRTERGTVLGFLASAADKLDVPSWDARPARPGFRQKGIDILSKGIVEAQSAFGRALAPLTPEEQQELRANLYPQTTGTLDVGHRFADVEAGRRVCNLIEKIDRRALLEAAAALAILAEPETLRRLRTIPAEKNIRTEGATGDLIARIPTPTGSVILVGGPGPNEYRLDEMPDVCAVVDQGGNDIYIEGTVSTVRPVLVIIDLAGNDTYRGANPGIQGGAIMGISLLVDAEGNDTYDALDVAQGSSLCGVGILIDRSGNDSYRGLRRVQGQAVGGVGLLLDRGGNDEYRGAMLAQGVGGPLGFGVLDDLAGNDHYYAGGKYPGGYDDTPGYGGWSQGVGVGPRGSANGGIGVLLDGGGDDLYEADYFSHGGGYWFAAGFARDFGGNDKRIGATRFTYDGEKRKTETRFVRWGPAYGCHYALGFVFDDTGNDVYVGTHASLGYAWDIGVGVLCDAEGNDRYETPNSGIAQAHEAGFAVVFDASGNDEYESPEPGFAGPTVNYHPADKAGGNFAFLIDLDGNDRYGAKFGNHTEYVRGWAGGFLIDR